MEDATTWFAAQRKQAAGQQTTCVRGRKESAPITATMSRRQYEVIERDGSVTLVDGCDFTFTAEEIVIEGASIEPRSGDILRVTVGGRVLQFEVLPIGKLPCCEWLDSSGIIYLVHSKLV